MSNRDSVLEQLRNQLRFLRKENAGLESGIGANTQLMVAHPETATEYQQLIDKFKRALEQNNRLIVNISSHPALLVVPWQRQIEKALKEKKLSANSGYYQSTTFGQPRHSQKIAVVKELSALAAIPVTNRMQLILFLRKYQRLCAKHAKIHPSKKPQYGGGREGELLQECDLSQKILRQLYSWIDERKRLIQWHYMLLDNYQAALEEDSGAALGLSRKPGRALGYHPHRVTQAKGAQLDNADYQAFVVEAEKEYSLGLAYKPEIWQGFYADTVLECEKQSMEILALQAMLLPKGQLPKEELAAVSGLARAQITQRFWDTLLCEEKMFIVSIGKFSHMPGGEQLYPAMCNEDSYHVFFGNAELSMDYAASVTKPLDEVLGDLHDINKLAFVTIRSHSFQDTARAFWVATHRKERDSEDETSEYRAVALEDSDPRKGRRVRLIEQLMSDLRIADRLARGEKVTADDVYIADGWRYFDDVSQPKRVARLAHIHALVQHAQQLIQQGVLQLETEISPSRAHSR